MKRVEILNDFFLGMIYNKTRLVANFLPVLFLHYQGFEKKDLD
jgi:hypothetical protein